MSPSFISKNIALCMAEDPLKHPLFTTFLLVSRKHAVCKRPYISSSFPKKIDAPPLKSFSKQPFFTKFSLFLTVSEVCIFSIKY